MRTELEKNEEDGSFLSYEFNREISEFKQLLHTLSDQKNISTMPGASNDNSKVYEIVNRTIQQLQTQHEELCVMQSTNKRLSLELQRTLNHMAGLEDSIREERERIDSILSEKNDNQSSPENSVNELVETPQKRARLVGDENQYVRNNIFE